MDQMDLMDKRRSITSILDQGRCCARIPAMNTITTFADFDLHCYGCGASAPRDAAFTCDSCGEPRSLRALSVPPTALFREQARSMWHYAPLLPVPPAHIVTLEEGATPLVRAARMGTAHGFAELSFKNEMTNPTGSFKDRQIAVGISHARAMGRDTVAVVSSGNVAAATAAYAARAGMRAVLFMHGQAGAGKIAQAAAYGATVIKVDSPSPSVVFDLCLEACAHYGWYHLSTAGMYEPYNVEGAKTIAYELYQQTAGELPDWIVAPVGGGGLLGGIWRGFLDLQRVGLISEIPKLCGVQAAGCAPLVEAIEKGTPFLETLKHPWPDPKTIAGGIADDIIFDGHTVLPAIRQTDGAAIAVDDVEIYDGLQALARQEGLLCELTCAVTVAALAHLKQAEGQRVCGILSGNGTKDLQYLAQRAPEVPKIAADLGALERLLAVKL